MDSLASPKGKKLRASRSSISRSDSGSLAENRYVRAHSEGPFLSLADTET